MKTIKSELKTDIEGYNMMEPREKIEELLIHYLGQNGTSKFEYVDVIGKSYWENCGDTLVIALDPTEATERGATSVMGFALALHKFIKEAHCDEDDHITLEGKTIIRFWWD